MKKQVRLHDIYRMACTGMMSNIKGVDKYDVICSATTSATTVTVTYSDTHEQVFYFANDEFELKDVIYTINKRLNNCQKPGRKSKWNKKS